MTLWQWELVTVQDNRGQMRILGKRPKTLSEEILSVSRFNVAAFPATGRQANPRSGRRRSWLKKTTDVV